MKMSVVIRPDEGGWFVAECPALPGCVSQGKTKKEALANIHEAIEGVLLVLNEKTKRRAKKGVEIRAIAV